MPVAAGHRSFPRLTAGPGLGLPSRGPWLGRGVTAAPLVGERISFPQLAGRGSGNSGHFEIAGNVVDILRPRRYSSIILEV